MRTLSQQSKNPKPAQGTLQGCLGHPGCATRRLPSLALLSAALTPHLWVQDPALPLLMDLANCSTSLGFSFSICKIDIALIDPIFYKVTFHDMQRTPSPTHRKGPKYVSSLDAIWFLFAVLPAPCHPPPHPPASQSQAPTSKQTCRKPGHGRP